jgi:glucokinase
MILAGDIGGTKTNLALYDWSAGRVEPVRLETFHCADYKSLEEILEEFLTPPKPPMLLDDIEVATPGEEEAEVESFPEEPIKLAAAWCRRAGDREPLPDHQLALGGGWGGDSQTIQYSTRATAQRS